MVFPSLPPQDYELYPGPPYSTRWVADLACADDAIETTDVVKYHGRTTILRNHASQ